jgi:hypothetical protein
VADTILFSDCFAEAWGVVGVNRVASVAERGILKF